MVANVVITLLRHGRTLDNEASRYSGWIDSELSEAGRAEILKTKKLYTKEGIFAVKIDQIYTSDLTRTIETANLLFQKDYPIHQLKDLREMHFGDFEGLSYEELKNNSNYQDWLNHLFTYELPHGESFEQFTQRIDKVFQQIKTQVIERSLKHIVLVVHGGVIRYLLTKLADDSRTFFEYEIPFAQGYQLSSSQAEFKEESPCMSLQAVPTMGSGNS